MPNIQKDDADLQWDNGRARAACDGNGGCGGPIVCNLSFGPDGEGRRIFSVCNDQCRSNIEHSLGPGLWISVRER